MPPGRFRIGKSFTFEVGHRLPGLPPEHQCSRQHGHSYTVEGGGGGRAGPPPPPPRGPPPRPPRGGRGEHGPPRGAPPPGAGPPPPPPPPPPTPPTPTRGGRRRPPPPPPPPPPGFVTDFADLRPFKNFLDTELDHRNLHEVLPAEPTSELLAQFLAGWFIQHVQPLGIPASLYRSDVRF
ncbi:6-carboxytetrahydropterin synthase [Kitasatospora sp. NPDC101447]|uniref:6-carboxytetrahydropterin synthase n=1 Tax=Kitasatospora sp. NPDC101447 TaxID=3364102 RepID=UPI003812EB2E